ncbi:unnamed protein product, partial [Meganyctiphanes norvegica]
MRAHIKIFLMVKIVDCRVEKLTCPQTDQENQSKSYQHHADGYHRSTTKPCPKEDQIVSNFFIKYGGKKWDFISSTSTLKVKSEPTEDGFSEDAAAPITSSSQITDITPTIFIKTELQEINTTTSADISQPQSVNCRTTTTEEADKDPLQITDNTQTIFIKTEPQEVPTTTSAHFSQPQLVNCTTAITEVADADRLSSDRSCNNEKQKSSLISVQSISRTNPKVSVTVLVDKTGCSPAKILVKTPPMPTNHLSKQISEFSSTTMSPSEMRIPSLTTPITAINPEIYKSVGNPEELVFPKPPYTLSCLIALALRNSTAGCLSVAGIYSFICEHFPYFRTTQSGRKSFASAIRKNKYFERVQQISGFRGAFWVMNPTMANKIEAEIQKCSKKDLLQVKYSMQNPDNLESMMRGDLKFETRSITPSSEGVEDDEKVIHLYYNDNAVTSPAFGMFKITNPTNISSKLQVIASSNHTQDVQSSFQNAASSVVVDSNTTPCTITSQAVIRPSSASSHEEFALSDSTTADMSMLLNELGIDIKADTEASMQESVQIGPQIGPIRSAVTADTEGELINQELQENNIQAVDTLNEIKRTSLNTANLEEQMSKVDGPFQCKRCHFIILDRKLYESHRLNCERNRRKNDHASHHGAVNTHFSFHNTAETEDLQQVQHQQNQQQHQNQQNQQNP